MASPIETHCTGITTYPIVGGKSIVLPRGPKGLRLAGMVIIPLGVMLVCGPVLMASLGALMGLLLVPMVLAGLALIIVGAYFVAGHAEVEVADRVITVINRCGPFGVRRHRPLEQLMSLTLHVTPSDGAGRYRPGFVHAQFKQSRDLFLGIGYQADALEELVTLIVEIADEVGVPVAVLSEDSRERRPHGRVVAGQPAASDVAVHSTDQSVFLHLPPEGVARGAPVRLWFSTVWIPFSAAATVAASLSGQGMAMMLYVPCVLLGLGALVSAIERGRRTATIAVIRDKLVLKHTSLFGVDGHEWPQSALGDLRVRRSEEGEKATLEVRSHTGARVTLRGERNLAEILWIASVLRDALGGLPAPPARPAAGAPAGSAQPRPAPEPQRLPRQKAPTR